MSSYLKEVYLLIYCPSTHFDCVLPAKKYNSTMGKKLQLFYPDS